MFADRIKTPLLLMHGEQDHNVPFRQSMEMYHALRRLGKGGEVGRLYARRTRDAHVNRRRGLRLPSSNPRAGGTII